MNLYSLYYSLSGWWHPWYLTGVTLMTLWLVREYGVAGSRLMYREDSRLQGRQLWILTGILILFVGLRPLDFHFGDTMYYVNKYIRFHGKGDAIISFDWLNLFFDNLYYWFRKYELGLHEFFLAIAWFYFIGIAVACRKLFPSDSVYGFVINLGAFSTFSYAVNGFKAGAAAAMFLVALAYRRKWWVWLPMLALSYGFHHSMVVPIAVFALCRFRSCPKVCFAIWCLCVLVAASGWQWIQHFLAPLSDRSGVLYLTNWENGYDSGFRPDFILYGAVPIVSGMWLMIYEGYKSKTYDFLFCTYTLTNAVWLSVMYASCTNRIAYLSWLMMPIVLPYPFFDRGFTVRQFRKLNLVAGCQLGFTLMMSYLYNPLVKGFLRG